MNYDQFLENLSADIKAAMEPELGALHIEIRDVEKLSGQSYTGLMIRKESENIAMSLNLTKQFEQLEQGRPYIAITNEVIGEVTHHMENMPSFSVEQFDSYETIREHLTMEVVGTKENRDMLRQIPHREMEDLSVVYRYELGESSHGSMSTLITNEMIEHFGISPEQLHEDAVRSAPELNPPTLRPMFDVLADMAGPGMGMPPMGPPIYVATTMESQNGACVIAYPGFLEYAKDIIGDQLFILPSSKHEVLILPDNGEFNTENLMDMVCTVNRLEVAPEDRLADNVYHYDGEDHVFETAKHYEDRMAEKEAALGNEKGSILKDLEEHKKECVGKTSPTDHKRNAPVL